MNYTWTITNCEHNIATGGIVKADWTAMAEEDGYQSSCYGQVTFEPDPDSPDFIPYANVTEEEVLNWVWDAVDKADVELSLAGQVEYQKSPVVAGGTPWSSQQG